MAKRSNISPGIVFKSARMVGPSPWIVSKLVRLQLAKQFFSLATPQAELGLGRRIHQLSIRITDVCNLRCHTCGQWGDNGFLLGSDLKELKKAEVRPERYLELMTDLVNHGHRPNVYIWGGEPMMYPGTLRVIEGATRLGLPTSIVSNGHNLAPAAERLAAAPLFLMQTSIDGHDEATHNAARPGLGKSNAFADVVSALEALGKARRDKGAKLPLLASLSVASRNNLPHLADIYRSFRDKVDLFVFYLGWWITPERAELHEKDFARRFGFKPKLHRGWIGDWQVDDNEILNEQIALLRELSRPISAPPVTFIPNITAPEDLRRYYADHSSRFGYDQCTSIFQVVELDSNGDMSPCRDYHDYIVGNVKENTISELFNCERFRAFRRSIHNEGLMPVCSRCCGLMGY